MSPLDAEVLTWLDHEELEWITECGERGETGLRESRDSIWEGEGSMDWRGGRPLKEGLNGESLPTRIGGKDMPTAGGLGGTWVLFACLYASGGRPLIVDDLSFLWMRFPVSTKSAFC
jgi:hypothetical protein